MEDSSCELCRQGAETVLHVLWECGVAQDVWAGSKVCLQKCMMARADILQLIEDLMTRLTVEDMELFFVQCWGDMESEKFSVTWRQDTRPFSAGLTGRGPSKGISGCSGPFVGSGV